MTLRTLHNITEFSTLVDNQALRPILVEVPHEFGLAVAPPSAQGQPECREQLIAQRHLIVIIFRRRDRQDRFGARRFEQVAYAHRLASTRIGDDYMPAPLVPGRTQHRLKPFFKGGFDEDVLPEEGMGHGRGVSSGSVRIRNGRTGRSGSASGTAGGRGAT